MLWAADVNGRVAGLTRPWLGLEAGRSVASVGPHVLPAVQAVLRSVFPSKQPASTRYPILYLDDRAVRIQVDASPALSPDTGSFVGYLGSVHPVAGDTIPSSMPGAEKAMLRVVLLDAMAENVVAARALAVQTNERELVKTLDLALLLIGDQLAKAETGGA